MRRRPRCWSVLSAGRGSAPSSISANTCTRVIKLRSDLIKTLKNLFFFFAPKGAIEVQMWFLSLSVSPSQILNHPILLKLLLSAFSIFYWKLLEPKHLFVKIAPAFYLETNPLSIKYLLSDTFWHLAWILSHPITIFPLSRITRSAMTTTTTCLKWKLPPTNVDPATDNLDG